MSIRNPIRWLAECLARHVVRFAVGDLDSDTYLNALIYKLRDGGRFPGHVCLLLPIELEPQLAARALFQLSLRLRDEKLAGRCIQLLLAINGEQAPGELTYLLLSASYAVRRAAALQLRSNPDSDWDAGIVRWMFLDETTAQGKSLLLDLLATRPEELPDFETETALWESVLLSGHLQLKLAAINAVAAGGQRATNMIRLLLQLEHHETAREVRQALMAAIASALTNQEKAVNRLVRLVNDPDTEIACSAMNVLPRMGEHAKRAAAALTLELLSANPRRRELARQTLAAINWQSETDSAGSIAAEPLSALSWGSAIRFLTGDSLRGSAAALQICT